LASDLAPVTDDEETSRSPHSGFSPSGCVYTVQLAGLGEKIQTTLINLESDRVNNSLFR